jgi:uncharacterized protein YprB with RNaseH-like and TPR domain/Icc-related predicted phosphoesterase
MRILAFSDWRVQPIEDVDWALEAVSPQPDFLVYAGDDVTRFGEPSFEVLLEQEARAPAHWMHGRFLPPANSKPPRVFVGAYSRYRTLAVGVEKQTEEMAFSALARGATQALRALSRSQPHQSGEESGFDPFLALRRALRRGMSAIAVEQAMKTAFRLAFQKRGGHLFAVFCACERPQQPNEFVRLARRSRYGLGAIIGNDCDPSDRDIIRGPRVSNLHFKPRLLGGFGVIGLEACPEPNGIVTYKEADALSHLRRGAAQFPQGTPLIVVSHAPPHGVLDLALRFGVGRIGSRALRAFIGEHNVRLVVCGHCHMGGGRAENIGRCLVVNVANHDSLKSATEGRLGVIDIDRRSAPKVEWVMPRELKTTALHGIGPARTKLLAAAGIKKRDQVLGIDPQSLAKVARVSVAMAQRWQLQAKAIHARRFIPVPVRVAFDEFPRNYDLDDELLFYDIETLPLGQGDQIWLIGVQHSSARTVTHFLAKTPKDERIILEQFMALIGRFPTATLACYSGTDFDHRYVHRRLEHFAPPDARRFQMRHKVDVLSYLRHHAVPPSSGWGLKAVTSALRIQRRHMVTGLDLALAYLESLGTKVQPNWDVMLEYNEDDVVAIPLLLERFRRDLSIYRRPGSPTSQRSRRPRPPTLEETETILLGEEVPAPSVKSTRREATRT